MKLVLMYEEHGLFHIYCTRSIALPQVTNASLENLLGSSCYRHKILLNLEKSSYMDTSGVSWLIHCHRACKEAGGRFIVHSIPPMVDQMLQLLRMGEVLSL